MTTSLVFSSYAITLTQTFQLAACTLHALSRPAHRIASAMVSTMGRFSFINQPSRRLAAFHIVIVVVGADFKHLHKHMSKTIRKAMPYAGFNPEGFPRSGLESCIADLQLRIAADYYECLVLHQMSVERAQIGRAS